MHLGRAIYGLSRSFLSRCQRSLLVRARQDQRFSSILSSQFHSLHSAEKEVIRGKMVIHPSLLNTFNFQQFGYLSSAPSQDNGKQTAQFGNEQESAMKSNDGTAKANGDTEVSDTESSASEGTGSPNEKEESDSDDDLTKDDLVKLILEKEELLNFKQKEIEKLQEKVLRTYAEMQNSMDRARRNSENSKKFAIQNFASALLEVADNLGRASAVTQESFSKIDASKDTVGIVPLLKTLLEGVEMTKKQLAEVFRKFEVEKFDPTNEQFDPNRHNAVFQVPDSSKPPGTVAVVLKAGYMLHDRVIRPAEVGVTVAVEEAAEPDQQEDNKGSEA